MSDVEVFNIMSNMDVNADGDTLVTCPECEKEITVAFSNIVDDSMALSDCVVCPICNRSLDQVHPSGALNNKIADHVAKELVIDFEKGLGPIFKKFK